MGVAMQRILIVIAALAIASVSFAGDHLAPADVTFRSDQVGVSFSYPGVWGEALVRECRGTASYADNGMDWEIRFAADPSPCRACLLVREVGAGGNLRIVAHEGSADTTELDALRHEVAKSPDRTVNGCPARVKDMYFEPSGEAWRVTSWFSDGRFFEFREACKVREFANHAEHAGLWLGVTQLSRANPADTRLERFTQATARLLDSIRW